MKNIHLVICNFFFLISWKGTRWKIHNLKRTENEGNSPEQKKKNINIVIWYASLVRSTKNEGRSWEFFYKYPYIYLISFSHYIAISSYQLGEKGRKWKIYNLKRAENEGYSPEHKMKNFPYLYLIFLYHLWSFLHFNWSRIQKMKDTPL